MEWVKKGLIYKPSGHEWFSKSHAQLPVVDYLKRDNLFRVYYSTRDSQSRSRPLYIDLLADDPTVIVNVAESPILELGERGTFDDCGVMPSWIVNYDGKKYLYYIGWNIRNTISYHNSVGLAISEDDGRTFKKFSQGPLWDRDYKEPHYSGTSCVIIDAGVWKNWYLSCTEWRLVNGKPEPRYHIKYAESKDGINWIRDGVIAIDYLSNEEAGIVRASVLKENGIFKMWYSYRNFDDYRTNRANSYRIGYAESIDGKAWERKDSEVGIERSISGWDSQMIEYPHVVKHKSKKIMFYNGNGFGESGFGYAELAI